MDKPRKPRVTTDPNILLEKVLDNFTLFQSDMIRMYFKTIPPSKQRRYIKALKGKSLATAVVVHCYECMGWKAEEVEGCTSCACPLFLYRPYK